MTRQVGALLLGIIWVGMGGVFVLIDETPTPVGGPWEDARGWVWIIAGLACIVGAIINHVRWPLVVLSALASERIAVVGATALISRHFTVAPLVSLLAWSAVMVAVLAVLSLPYTQGGRHGH